MVNFYQTSEMPDVCLSFVLLFTIFIIVVMQKLVLQRSKNVTAKCMENLLPPPCILYLLELDLTKNSITSPVQWPLHFLIKLGEKFDLIK